MNRDERNAVRRELRWDVPVLLDALDTAERERDEYRALVTELSAPRGHAMRGCPYPWDQCKCAQYLAALPDNTEDTE